MWAALSLALSDSLAPAGRRALLLSLGGALLLLVGLWLGASALLAVIHVSRFHWLDTVVDVVGSLAALFIAWLLFPAMSMLVLGLFIEPVVAAIERTHYPGLPPVRRIGIGEAITSGVRLALLALVLNLLMLPLYLFPVVNVAIYYGLNGYLVGRAYFETIALRRMERRNVRSMWHGSRGQLSIAGAIIAVLLSLPLINLVAPLIGAAFMLHLFEALRRRVSADTAAGSR
jgi:CysZ protein